MSINLTDTNDDVSRIGFVQEGPLISKSKNIDKVGDRYIVNVNKPIPKLNGGFAKAYEVNNEKESPTENNLYYALIFEPHAPIRLMVANYFRKSISENITVPIDIEIVPISITSKNHVVIVFKQPYSMSLEEYIASYGPCSLLFITDKVLMVINKLLIKFEEVNLVHGRINPSNIFIDPHSHNVILGECLSEPPSYSQKQFYCPLEVANCLPVARGCSDVSVDTFALGATALYLFIGREAIPANDKKDWVSLRLSDGTYNVITTNVLIAGGIKILLKGVMSDKYSERWKSKQVNEWCTGQKTSLPSLAENRPIRPLEFLGKNYYNFRPLVYDMQRNWDATKNYIKEDKLIKWVDRTLNFNEMAEKLSIVSYSFAREANSLLIKKNEREDGLVKILFVLDPNGSLHMRDFSFMLTGVLPLITSGFVLNNKEYIEYAYKIIKIGCWKSILELKNSEKVHISEVQISNILDRISEHLEKPLLGFGLERCLYDLNPYSACLSEIVKNEYIYTIEELLLYFDRIVGTKDIPIMDKHIAAFILSKLNSDKLFDFVGLKKFANLITKREIITLSIFAMAQNSTSIKKLENLSKRIARDIESVTEIIHNKKINEAQIIKLKDLAEKGNIQNMLLAFMNPSILEKDHIGFVTAAVKYKKLSNLRERLLDGQRIYDIGYQYGLKLCVIISYLLCVGVFIYFVY